MFKNRLLEEWHKDQDLTTKARATRLAWVIIMLEAHKISRDDALGYLNGPIKGFGTYDDRTYLEETQ